MAGRRRSFDMLSWNKSRADPDDDAQHVREDGSQNFVEALPVPEPVAVAPPAPSADMQPVVRKRSEKTILLATHPDSAVGERYSRSRKGKRGVPVYLTPRAHKQLKDIAHKLDVKIHDLMLDLVDELFVTHKLPRIARSIERPVIPSSDQEQRETR